MQSGLESRQFSSPTAKQLAILDSNKKLYAAQRNVELSFNLATMHSSSPLPTTLRRHSLLSPSSPISPSSELSGRKKTLFAPMKVGRKPVKRSRGR